MNVYNKLKNIFEQKQAWKYDRAIPGEYNCRVCQCGDAFIAKLHGNPIITAYPDYMIIDNCGWITPTTHARIYSIAGVRVYNDSKLRVMNTYRIYDRLRGIGLPFEDRIRMDYNGRVFDEDVKSDFKKHVNMKVKVQYDKLCRAIWDKISARIEVGEFLNVEFAPRRYLCTAGILQTLEQVSLAAHPEHSDILTLFAGVNINTEGWKEQVARLRISYYQKNGGYWMEEFPHK